MLRFASWGFLLLFGLWSCGGDDSTPLDGGDPDAGDGASSDGALPDSAPTDATPTDSTLPDTGPTDGALPDTGPVVFACNDCHGDDTSFAPPLDTAGNSATSFRGVGAHRSHLRTDTGWSRDILCTDCHQVPESVDAVGHTDTALPAELTWGTVPTADGASPSFDGATTTCNGVYCHGETLSGGTNTTPDWTNVGGGEATCGTCHSVPPPAPHPADANCATCHPTVDAGGAFILPQRHVDGVVDLVPGMLGCTTCHGSGRSPAPPSDVGGNVDTTARGVGAHRSHLGPSSWHSQITCNMCHQVPGTVGDVGHNDTGLPAELIFGALPMADGAVPVFDGATTTCSGVYCHGATLISGGSNTTPDWTIVGVSGMAQAACGTCHGLPPAAPHPVAADCSSCHPTIASDGSFPDPARHIDGIVDVVTLDCTSCHGDVASGDSAPPRDTTGNVATTARGVGAHQSHLGASTWRAPIACSECHVRPADVADVGHNDTPLPAELAWGLTAMADGAVPVFDGSTMTCSGVYCHGETLIAGGTGTRPDWTSVGTGEADCGTCHGLPPAAPHPADTDCSACHSTVAADDRTFVFPNRHVDGVVDLIALDCTSCHGDIPSGDPAPPRDTTGATATTARGVGAHQSHLAPSTWRASIDCSECHVRPSAISDPGHRDSALPAELIFGARATADSATPSFNGGTTTCSGVYCHGETLAPGGTNTTPDWTNVGAGEAACGTCHGLPPGGTHTTIATCEDCHSAVVGPGLTIIAPHLHVDGTVQVSNYHPTGWSAPTRHGSTVNNTGYTNCQTCHGAALDGGTSGVSCASCHSGWETDCTFCHGGTLDMTGAPPEGIDDETLRTLLAVGAHIEHVSTTAMHLAWDCDQCHVTPTSALSPGHIDGDGRAEVAFGALNPAATYAPSTGTCGALYCHGNGSSTLGTMRWDVNPTLDCGSCHADFFSPTETELRAMSGEHKKHVRDEDYGCEVCHADSVDASGNILRLDRHVDGVVDVTTPSYDPDACGGRGSCAPSCHDDECWD